METTSSVSDFDSNPNPSSDSRTFGVYVTPLRVFRYPLSSFLEYSGLLRTRPDNPETDLLIPDTNNNSNNSTPNNSESSESISSGNGSEVSIRIIGAGENDHRDGDGLVMDDGEERGLSVERSTIGQGDSGNGNSNSRDSSYQRYDIQQAARWLEQFLPFTLLLLVVFIRQHLQGFFAVIWITAFMFRSNDILRKQTALKYAHLQGERKITVLLGYFLVFMLHISGIYWWNRKDDLFYPLLMVPPKAIPPFWHAIFIILVNDTMVRQAAMALKLVLLMYYKNGRGHNFRRQGQLLTLVEYMLLLYRALLPTPVWYRFFLNKEYGSLFSSLITGLYLTFKLTSIVEKVRSFFTALKALSIKEIHYGSYATPEQVNAAGDLCAICQEKMNTPILLRCKHIFCEDCVSEWFERERTCPLCRALVRPADLRSFGDGSTSLLFQLF
ncbi:E3 ubiquitin-protein ligase RNFT1 isoform X2 [Capsicum galapagoense]